MKKVELLAPAGGYETMVGAFNAGADAVYIGGNRFGARAYAENFDTQQVLDTISYAHLHGKKIYLTVNTLVKEREFDQLYDFMLPFAEKRLDGVIVQDYGVMRFIRDEFPNVELHASTQQTVTGVYGAKLLKELGCTRVVPARELSLYEMKNIREKADIEVEAFIHGAMCYCYSGACLFSSMVGGRSGNRGRCAQPCRLPYSSHDNQNEIYPLSLKDMCTIDILPELIQAGIDSFKIEGRMKKPEYSAGVTSLYRKYIDRYYADPKGRFEITKEDRKMLEHLYLRTEISSGYYYKHNGRDMLTINSPAYNATSEEVLSSVREKYLGSKLKIKCRIEGYFTLGQEAVVNMSVDTPNGTIYESAIGNVVGKAMKRPMDKADIIKQLSKLGESDFEAESIEVVIDDNGSQSGIFIPVGELNKLRREVCSKIKAQLMGETDNDTSVNPNKRSQTCKKAKPSSLQGFSIFVRTYDQLNEVLEYVSKDYQFNLILDTDLFFLEKERITELFNTCKYDNLHLYIAFSYVTRSEEKHDGAKDVLSIINCEDINIDGVLVRNLEQLGVLKKEQYEGKVITDYGVYNWNGEAAALLKEISPLAELSVPLELTFRESKDLLEALDDRGKYVFTYNIYGRAPMMVTANCVKKTLSTCSMKQWEFNASNTSIIDRMGNVMPVLISCRNCCNVILNAHPTSLHRNLDSITDSRLFDFLRLDFTTESKNEVRTVLRAFLQKDKDSLGALDEMSHTTGHFKRGVE